MDILIEQNNKKMKTRVFEIGFILIATVTIALCLSCDSKRQPAPRVIEIIEGLTKSQIASLECITDELSNAVDAMQESIDNGIFTERGFVGSGESPDEIKSQCEWTIQRIKEAYDICHGAFYDEEIVNEKIPKGNENRNAVDKVIKKMASIRVDLSKFEPVEVAGKTKMWRYTELNTGYKYMATLDKDGNVTIKLSDETDLDDVLEEQNQYAQQLNDLYNEFQYGQYNLDLY